jgi:hypothetical protein
MRLILATPIVLLWGGPAQAGFLGTVSSATLTWQVDSGTVTGSGNSTLFDQYSGVRSPNDPAQGTLTGPGYQTSFQLTNSKTQAGTGSAVLDVGATLSVTGTGGLNGGAHPAEMRVFAEALFPFFHSVNPLIREFIGFSATFHFVGEVAPGDSVLFGAEGGSQAAQGNYTPGPDAITNTSDKVMSFDKTFTFTSPRLVEIVSGGVSDVDAEMSLTLIISKGTQGGTTWVQLLDPVSVNVAVGSGLLVSCVSLNPIAGAPFSGVVASFTDSDGDPLSHFTATLDWGDGTITTGAIAANASGGFTVSGSHTYASHGSFTLVVEVQDTDGNNGKGTCPLTTAASGQFSTPNQNATINFWGGTHGQALLGSFNGGPTSTALSTWLATSFPNLYGTGDGRNNLTGMTNAQVAALFETFYAEARPKPDAQALTLALNIYATTLSLGGNAGAAYGFSVTNTGLGASFVSLGSNGAAFDAPNNVAVTAYDLLKEANAHTVNGVLYSGDGPLLQQFLNVVIGLNDTGMNG